MVEHGPAVTYIDGPDETASTLFISPQVEELLGYTAGGVDVGPRSVAAPAPSRRPGPRDRGERAAQRDGRAVPPRVPDVPQGRSRRLGARRGHDRARRARHAPVLARRDDGHLRAQAGRGPRRVPDVSRLADRPAEPFDVRGAAGALDRAGAAARRRRGGALRRHRRLPARERLARPPPGRRPPEDGGGPPPGGDARDRPRGAARRRPVPAAALGPRTRRAPARWTRRSCAPRGPRSGCRRRSRRRSWWPGPSCTSR